MHTDVSPYLFATFCFAVIIELWAIILAVAYCYMTWTNVVMMCIICIVMTDFYGTLMHIFFDQVEVLQWPSPFSQIAQIFQDHHVIPNAVTASSAMRLISDISPIFIVYIVTSAIIMICVHGHMSVTVIFYTFFMTMFASLSQLTHQWAHMHLHADTFTKMFQQNGIIISKQYHHQHHHINGGNCNFAIFIGIFDSLFNKVYVDWDYRSAKGWGLALLFFTIMPIYVCSYVDM